MNSHGVRFCLLSSIIVIVSKSNGQNFNPWTTFTFPMAQRNLFPFNSPLQMKPSSTPINPSKTVQPTNPVTDKPSHDPISRPVHPSTSDFDSGQKSSATIPSTSTIPSENTKDSSKVISTPPLSSKPIISIPGHLSSNNIFTDSELAKLYASLHELKNHVNLNLNHPGSDYPISEKSQNFNFFNFDNDAICEKSLNSLIGALMNSSLYSSQMAFYFRVSTKGKEGFAIYFDIESRQDLEYSKKVIEILIKNGGPITNFPAIVVKKNTWPSVLAAFDDRIAAQIQLKTMIRNLRNMALFICQDPELDDSISQAFSDFSYHLDNNKRLASYLRRIQGNKGGENSINRDLLLRHVGANPACAPSPSQLVLYQDTPKIREVLLAPDNLVPIGCNLKKFDQYC